MMATKRFVSKKTWDASRGRTNTRRTKKKNGCDAHERRLVLRCVASKQKSGGSVRPVMAVSIGLETMITNVLPTFLAIGAASTIGYVARVVLACASEALLLLRSFVVHHPDGTFRLLCTWKVKLVALGVLFLCALAINVLKDASVLCFELIAPTFNFPKPRKLFPKD